MNGHEFNSLILQMKDPVKAALDVMPDTMNTDELAMFFAIILFTYIQKERPIAVTLHNLSAFVEVFRCDHEREPY
jgi:hypothetical protein